MLDRLNSLINVRNFLNLSINDLSVNMTSEKYNAISKKIAILNKKILDLALDLDVDCILKEVNYVEKFSSTKEITNILELDKICSAINI